MSVDGPAKNAVDELNIQQFFLTMNDNSVSNTQKDAARGDKMQALTDQLASSIGGSDLSGWNAHIQAELRSGEAPMQEILKEILTMRTVEQQIDEVGANSARAANGYGAPSSEVEQVAHHVKPDTITPDTLKAYTTAQAAKALSGPSPADG